MTLIDITTEDYRSAVESFAKNKSKINFPNHGAIHASIVMENIFKNSVEVSVFSRGMNGTISRHGNYQKELHELLLRDSSQVKFLLQNKPSDSSPTLNQLKQFPSKCKVRILKPEYVTSLAKSNSLRRFAVGDGSFRLEIDSNTNKAICSFNNLGIVKQLKDNFEYLFSDVYSEEYSLN